MKKIGTSADPTLARLNLRPILYVEDNDDNWHVAELRLGGKFALHRASNDAQACRMLREPDTKFVAVLMDIELQGSVLNGIDLTRLMRGRPIERALPAYARDMPVLDMPIIFMTAYGDIYAESTLRAAGGDRVMTKPIDFKALNMALMNLYVSRSASNT